MYSKPTSLKSLAVAAIAALIPTSLGAQQLNYSTSCVGGFVGAYDWAEVSANFKETGWDSRASVRLIAADDQITLIVTDINNTNQVCDNVADLRTSCTWTLSPGGVYVARIDNTTRSTETAYQLCAN